MDSFADAVTFVVVDSSVVITAERALDIEDCFRVAVRQVFVSNWVSKLELVVVPLLELLSFDRS